MLYKDDILDGLAEKNNVAQFVSFSPGLDQRFSRVFGYKPNEKFESVETAIKSLLSASPENTVNVRSFLPDQPQSHEFLYGLGLYEEVYQHVCRLAEQGLYTIVNETIDVNDGGVSGVLQNGVVEFAPGVIPRFVEKSGDPISTLPKQFAIKLLKSVYCFDPDIDYPDNVRVEFSLHPLKRGWKHSNTIIWEEEFVKAVQIDSCFNWPTGFSKFLGDKAYGLIVAHLLGFPVPKTTVFSRNPTLGIFSYGVSTGCDDVWMRTCPMVQEPGKFTTVKGWKDPYVIMDSDDPDGSAIASCLAQQGVSAQYSGALISSADGVLIEGVEGTGGDYMIGIAEPINLPDAVTNEVLCLYQIISDALGPVRMEWAYDGREVWVLQLHVGVSESLKRVIYPGEVYESIDYYVSDGLEVLRSIIKNIKLNTGILVHGNIGMCSHIADVLRKAKIPSSIA